MDDITSKADLVAVLSDGRALWEGLVAEAGVDRLEEAGACGDWSLKDVLGHLAAFDRFWGSQIRGAVSGVPPSPRDLFDRDTVPPRSETEEEQNAAIHALYAPLPAAVVLAKWRVAADLLREGVAALAEEDLFTAGRFPWAGERPLALAMAGDTYRHAAAHAEGVRAWLGRTTA